MLPRGSHTSCKIGTKEWPAESMVKIQVLSYSAFKHCNNKCLDRLRIHAEVYKRHAPVWSGICRSTGGSTSLQGLPTAQQLLPALQLSPASLTWQHQGTSGPPSPSATRPPACCMHTQPSRMQWLCQSSEGLASLVRVLMPVQQLSPAGLLWTIHAPLFALLSAVRPPCCMRTNLSQVLCDQESRSQHWMLSSSASLSTCATTAACAATLPCIPDLAPLRRQRSLISFPHAPSSMLHQQT